MELLTSLRKERCTWQC